jgi:hypothetical protein
MPFVLSSFADFFCFACQSSVFSSEPGLKVLSGSACLRFPVYIQDVLGMEIIIPSYAIVTVSSP